MCTRAPTFFENNLVYGNTSDYVGLADQTGMNGNISEGPLFLDPALGDYRLSAGSPAISVGLVISGQQGKQP